MHDFLDVLTLHKRFDFPRSEFPALPEHDVFLFRYHFLNEELDEYHVSYNQRNLVGVVDALLDFVYVACGTALFIGAPRSGPQANWPSFRTAHQALIGQGIIDEHHLPPSFLSEPLHSYTYQSLRSRVQTFQSSYLAARDGDDEEGCVLYLMLMALKQCVDEAYKAAALMNIPWEKCWDHVANANLKKRPGIVPKRDYRLKYDLIKPAGWIAPDAAIATELVMEGWHIPASMEIDNVTGKVRMAI